jgi:hypothetical protein
VSVLQQIRKKPVCINNVLHHSHGILIGCYILVITDKVTRSVLCNKAEGGQADHYDSHCDLQILYFPAHKTHWAIRHTVIFSLEIL